jgi:hypothetical protein
MARWRLNGEGQIRRPGTPPAHAALDLREKSLGLFTDWLKRDHQSMQISSGGVIIGGVTE